MTLGIPAANHFLRLLDWQKIGERLTGDSLRDGAKGLFRRLKKTDQEVAAQQAIAIFIEEFYSELEGTAPLTAAIPGYHDQLKELVEVAAPEIVGWLQPEAKEVDLGPVERIWSGIALNPLPEGFSWSLVAQNFARGIRRYVRKDQEMRSRLSIALQEQIAESLERIAGPAAGFQLEGYRLFLIQKCRALQLAVMHTSTYRYDRQITLWSVFVPQSARESAPVRDMPRELIRRLREEGHLAKERDEPHTAEMRERYQNSAKREVFEILERERLVVVLGDPGSGKTSLLKYLVLRWTEKPKGPLPLWVDLKEYAKTRGGLLKYLESGSPGYRLDPRELDQRLRLGEAALYLDGLDEIFDGPTRGSVIEEVAAFVVQYAIAPVVITSRIVGYEPERLHSARFTHATLEDFDSAQVSEFLRRWHDVAETDSRERARLQGQLHMAITDSSAIRELSGNPLLLTMMAILNRTQDLPRDRVELYREASRVLLHEWDASRALAVDTFARQEKEALLRELAGEMQQAAGGLAGNLIDRSSLIELFQKFLGGLGVPDPYTKSQSLVEQLMARNFILCYAGADRFAFVHRTFLEYFCAAWFIDRFQVRQTLSWGQLRDEVFGQHWKDEKWHEVLRLISGLVAEEKANSLIQHLMKQDGREADFANLMLAAGCLSEVRNRRAIQPTDDALRKQFIQHAIIERRVDFRSPSWTNTVQGLQRAIARMVSVWRDEETRSWLRHATTVAPHETVRRAAVQELARGWRHDPETFALVRELTGPNLDSSVRATAARELAFGWREDVEALSILKDLARADKDWQVQLAAAEALAALRATDPEITPLLVSLVGPGVFPPVVQAIIRGMARASGKDPDILAWLKNLAASDHEWSVRETAVQEVARGWKEHAATLPWLKELAESSGDWATGRAAVTEVGQRWRDDPGTVVWVREKILSDRKWYVRAEAIQQLAQGWRNVPGTLALIKERVTSDLDRYVAETAVRTVADVWKPDADTPRWLHDLANSSDSWGVRRAALWQLAMHWKNDPSVLPLVKERAALDRIGAVRREAVLALALSWGKDPETTSLLKIRAQADGTESVRRTALQHLAQHSSEDPEVLPLLKARATIDHIPRVRSAAIRAIGRNWSGVPDTATWLKERALSDSEDTVRMTALKEFARRRQKSPGVISFLKERARLEKSEAVRRAATEVLSRRCKSDPEVSKTPRRGQKRG